MKKLFLIIFLLTCWVTPETAQAADEGQATAITTEELQVLLSTSNNPYVVIDARNAEEYQEVHIKGAINVPVKIFASKSDVLDKDKKIVVYCNSGGRSYNAYRKLMKLGYENIYQALFFDWKNRGLPVD